MQPYSSLYTIAILTAHPRSAKQTIYRQTSFIKPHLAAAITILSARQIVSKLIIIVYALSRPISRVTQALARAIETLLTSLHAHHHTIDGADTLPHERGWIIAPVRGDKRRRRHAGRRRRFAPILHNCINSRCVCVCIRAGLCVRLLSVPLRINVWRNARGSERAAEKCLLSSVWRV